MHSHFSHFWLFPWTTKHISSKNYYKAQWWLFNHFSLVKHRHQIWDRFLISVFNWKNWPWILPQFTTKNLKNDTFLLFDGYDFKIMIKKNHLSYLKRYTPKAHFYIKISRATLLLFWPNLLSKVWRRTLDLCLFFKDTN